MRVAVIGAGVMGADIALSCAAAGYEVVLKDISPDALELARESLPGKLRMYKMMEPKLKEWDATSLLQRIQFTLDYEPVFQADWIIENVPEEWAIKQAVYQELAAHCKPNVLIGVNTSCISITKVAALMPNPDRVVGTHFMNPVPVKKAVEVIRGHHTSEESITQTKQFLKTLGKKSIVVNDLPGFVANRLSHLFMNEAAFLIQDQVAEPAAIDAIFKQGYGHAMGPLETADLIGLDTVVKSLRVLYDSYQDPKFRCCPLLQKMVDAGELGRKSGKGFYSYS